MRWRLPDQVACNNGRTPSYIYHFVAMGERSLIKLDLDLAPSVYGFGRRHWICFWIPRTVSACKNAKCRVSAPMHAFEPAHFIACER